MQLTVVNRDKWKWSTIAKKIREKLCETLTGIHPSSPFSFRLLLLLLLLYPFILRERFSNEEIKRENFQRVSMRFDAMKFPPPSSLTSLPRYLSPPPPSLPSRLLPSSCPPIPFFSSLSRTIVVNWGKGNRPLERMPLIELTSNRFRIVPSSFDRDESSTNVVFEFRCARSS